MDVCVCVNERRTGLVAFFSSTHARVRTAPAASIRQDRLHGIYLRLKFPCPFLLFAYADLQLAQLPRQGSKKQPNPKRKGKRGNFVRLKNVSRWRSNSKQRYAAAHD